VVVMEKGGTSVCARRKRVRVRTEATVMHQ
jgi:hypothetical protein